ncbi:hypothetical protein [Celeribacter indicus]|uniref:DUF35 domain-containing protein n=1 Tax=Celeribacter indicus TaxID=1208324 RepID=A0A0B5DV14_9RHOB|nr:hypothetical protein [Celeribacter indicus]AJE45055.1 hypothetical protein P73_0340 [Celeribacter indicus]SDX42245.1 hypothetical protein SAMN05443573_12715 [Celeribacter indicus]
MSGDHGFRADPPTLLGSRDPATGQVYFPPRTLSADGALTRCEEVELSREGILHTWTQMGGRFYGQVDLPEKVRIQCVLAPGVPEIGAVYRLEAAAADDGAAGWRFARA